MRVTIVLALALAVVAAAATRPTVPQHECSDPCIQSARSTAKQCASSATGAFQDSLGGCLERDHECVQACRAVRQTCMDDTNLGVAHAQCDLALGVEQARCRNQYPPSLRRAGCLFKADVKNGRCRRIAERQARGELRACRAGFRSCARGCGPGEPPGGAGTCTVEAKGTVRSLLAGCRQAHQATVSACIDKDLTCLQSCIDARATCNAPTQAALDPAIASCNSQQAAAVMACQAANPGGGTAFDDCVQAAQANATACRDAAIQAAAPGLAACGGQYATCARACPPAGTASGSETLRKAAGGSCG